MKTDLILKFKQNLFSKVIWSSTFLRFLRPQWYHRKIVLESRNATLIYQLIFHINKVCQCDPIKMVCVGNQLTLELKLFGCYIWIQTPCSRPCTFCFIVILSIRSRILQSITLIINSNQCTNFLYRLFDDEIAPYSNNTRTMSNTSHFRHQTTGSKSTYRL